VVLVIRCGIGIGDAAAAVPCTLDAAKPLKKTGCQGRNYKIQTRGLTPTLSDPVHLIEEASTL
jgi:hypothetical protein